MKENGWRFSFIGITNLVMFVFLLGALVSPFAGGCREGNRLVFADEKNPLESSEAVGNALSIQEALREIYKEVSPAVVRIETEQTVKLPVHPFFNDPAFRDFFGEMPKQERKRTGLGSGFIINKSGFIVTNDHVVRQVDKITVKLQNNESYSAKLVGSDPISDIALLKIDGAKNLKSVHMGDSDAIQVGDFGIAIGNPFGLKSTFTLGVISSTGQDVDSADGVPRIQTDAAINPGNSGGPLLNIKGEVIGINQMIYSQSGGSVGIGFAIPVNYAKVVIENIKSGKVIRPGYIGIEVATNLSEENRKELGLKDKTGLLVVQVQIGSPAWKAGLRPYDFIVQVDGQEADKFSVLKSAVARKGAGSKLDIALIRDGKEEKISLTIGEAPASR